jgi:hypothetical protein
MAPPLHLALCVVVCMMTLNGDDSNGLLILVIVANIDVVDFMLMHRLDDIAEAGTACHVHNLHSWQHTHTFRKH